MVFIKSISILHIYLNLKDMFVFLQRIVFCVLLVVFNNIFVNINNLIDGPKLLF